MSTVCLPNFEIATFEKGDPNSDRLALVLPGRLETKDYIHMTSMVDLLSSLGFYAISFDPPGTWESSGEIEDYTMSNYLAAIDEFISAKGDPPTFTFGHSRGGTMAMLAACRNDAVTGFAAAMARPTKSVRIDGLEDGFPHEEIKDQPDGSGTRRFVLPPSYFEDAAQYNLVEEVRGCNKDKLFIAGEIDQTVDPLVIVECYQQAANPKELRTIRSDHHYRFNEQALEEVNRTVEGYVQSIYQID